MFVSRVLVPMFKMMENAKHRKDNDIIHDLKYLLVTFHDTNLSNLLRFLKYFDTYGFDKFVRFSSSLRFELLRDKKSLDKSDKQYRMRVVFDNEDIKLPFCSDTICDYTEFKEYLYKNLIFDYNEVEKYCSGGMGDAYVNELKFK